MKALSITSKIVNGVEFTLVKGWAAKGFSEADYRSECEAYGREVVHFQKLAGDKAGNVFDIILA